MSGIIGSQFEHTLYTADTGPKGSGPKNDTRYGQLTYGGYQSTQAAPAALATPETVQPTVPEVVPEIGASAILGAQEDGTHNTELVAD